ncbi:rna-directed dna polymerase from mobile element jockey-like [Pitangus sulphuratus]|nr:rna-directed dna polymerase from mobile element jockey-like [Pitangus sulphuratus]
MSASSRMDTLLTKASGITYLRKELQWNSSQKREMRKCEGKNFADTKHKFTKGKLCLANLIAFYDKVTCLADARQAVHIVYMDFFKAFNEVSHNFFLEKLMHCCLVVCVLCGKYLLFKLATNAVPQGSRLGPMLFNVFITVLEDGIKCTLMKFANDTKLNREVDTSERRITQQEDFNKLEEWDNKSLMKFRDKCKVFHIGKHNP